MTTFRPPRPPSSFPPRSRGFRRPPQETNDAHRINNRIIAREVRVIGPNGEQLGIMPTSAAIAEAEKDGLDLVEVAGQAVPPVCRIMDYGKFRYREQKKAQEAKKKRTEVELKELRVRYRTDVGDLETKIKQARTFLMEGNKVKFSMRFKGREVEYVGLGVAKFNEIAERLADVSVVDERSPAHGRQIHIVFAPSRK